MRRALLTLVLASLVSPVSLSAQTADVTTYKLTGARIAIGQDVRVERDEEVTDSAVVILGSLSVEARGIRVNTSMASTSFSTAIRNSAGISVMSIMTTWFGWRATTEASLLVGFSSRTAGGVGGRSLLSLRTLPMVRLDIRHPARARVSAICSWPPKWSSAISCTTPRTTSA